jgi:hypothetical protein
MANPRKPSRCRLADPQGTEAPAQCRQVQDFNAILS